MREWQGSQTLEMEFTLCDLDGDVKSYGQVKQKRHAENGAAVYRIFSVHQVVYQTLLSRRPYRLGFDNSKDIQSILKYIGVTCC